MKQYSFKSLVVAAIACVCVAVPAMSSAQRWPDDDRGYRGRGNDNGRWSQSSNWRLRDMVARTERESNEFRENFERQYRGRERGRNWGRDDYGYWGRDLRSDIQRMDEAFERLRRDVTRNDRRNSDGRRQMDLIVRYANEINQEFNSGFGNYRGGRSLADDWRELRRDISELARMFGSRGW